MRPATTSHDVRPSVVRATTGLRPAQGRGLNRPNSGTIHLLNHGGANLALSRLTGQPPPELPVLPSITAQRRPLTSPKRDQAFAPTCSIWDRQIPKYNPKKDKHLKKFHAEQAQAKLVSAQNRYIRQLEEEVKKLQGPRIDPVLW